MANSLRIFKSLAVTTVIGVAVGFGAAPYLSNVIPSEAEAEAIPSTRQRKIITEGRVEAIDGKVDVMAQLDGELVEVRVTEGDRVEKGDLLAVIDDRRAAAQVAIAEAAVNQARAELDRLIAGPGEAEIQGAAREVEAALALVEQQQVLVDWLKDRAEDVAERADQRPTLEQSQFQLEALRKRHDAAVERYKALRRGPLPEDIDAAKAAVELAEKRRDEANTNYRYHRVVAPIAGMVLEVYRHAGDSVQTGAPTPVLSMADTDRLRIRLEVQEVEAHDLDVGQEGVFSVRGRSGQVGRLEIERVLPIFDARRQFEPNTSARLDTRVLPMLCELTSCDVALRLNQRITAEFVPDSSGTSSEGD
jgi:multidrug resistance efflux pump